jgi:hypothetical protein
MIVQSHPLAVFCYSHRGRLTQGNPFAITSPREAQAPDAWHFLENCYGAQFIVTNRQFHQKIVIKFSAGRI